MKSRLFLGILMVMMLIPLTTTAQEPDKLDIVSEDIEIMSDGQAYASYLAAPAEEGLYPGIVLIHSFRGLEEGYRTMTDRFAAEGFVVLAVGWQTFEQSPADTVLEQLLLDSVDFLSAREDVDAEKLGLTGFCAGGRYTMLFLPQIDAFSAGVAWYGFPNSGANPAIDFVDELEAPLLIIHGTDDSPSPIAQIYEYATTLDAADKLFELKIYANEPHGFMLVDSQLREDEVGVDAFNQMVSYFARKLN